MVYQLLFSPTGGTAAAADALLAGTVLDLTDRNRDFSAVTLTADDVAVIAVPSYGGRVPAVAARRLAQVEGGGAVQVPPPLLLLVRDFIFSRFFRFDPLRPRLSCQFVRHSAHRQLHRFRRRQDGLGFSAGGKGQKRLRLGSKPAEIPLGQASAELLLVKGEIA